MWSEGPVTAAVRSRHRSPKGALFGKVWVAGSLKKCRTTIITVGLARLDKDGVWRPFNLKRVGLQNTVYVSNPGDPSCGTWYASVHRWGNTVGGGTYWRGQPRRFC